LWKAFFRLEFDGLMALLIITKLQKGKGKKSTTTYECIGYQPLIKDGPAQVAVAVINEMQLPVVEDAKIKELAEGRVGRTRAKKAAITDSEVGTNMLDLVRDIKTQLYAQADGKGHFQQATIVGEHGPDVLVLAAASDVGMSYSIELHLGASGAGSAAQHVNPEPLSPIPGSTPLGGEFGCAKPGRISGNGGKRRKKIDGEGEPLGQAKIQRFFSPCKPDGTPVPKPPEGGDGGGGNGASAGAAGASGGANSSSAGDSEPRSEIGGSQISTQLAMAYALLKRYATRPCLGGFFAAQ
jgi:hypothetical protein